jgi:hypothetical protein
VRRGRPSILATVGLVLASLTTGCSHGPNEPGPLTADWQPVALPPAPDGRLTVGDVLTCGGRWYALGGVRIPDGNTRPGAWTSTDGRTWTPVPVRATTPYGPQQLFGSAACSQDRVAALGTTSGGVHGNPRYNTWWGDADGLTDVFSGLDLFGGDNAVSVGRIAGGSGPSRYLVAGSWDDAAKRPHATVWASADGTRFDRRDSDPALASSAAMVTEAASAAYVGGEWLLAGNATPAGSANARDPVAWSSADAIGWRREEVGHKPGRDEGLQRITAWDGTALAIGVRGTGFGAWRRDPATHAWRAVGGFGQFTGDSLPGVTGLAVATDRGRPIAYVAGADGAALRLWASADAATWRPVRLPASFPAGGGHTLLVAEQNGRLLLAADDGTGVRLWLADPPPAPSP